MKALIFCIAALAVMATSLTSCRTGVDCPAYGNLEQTEFRGEITD